MRVRFVTTIEEELIHQIKIAAAKEQRNVNDILEELIQEYLKGWVNETSMAVDGWRNGVVGKHNARTY